MAISRQHPFARTRWQHLQSLGGRGRSNAFTTGSAGAGNCRNLSDSTTACSRMSASRAIRRSAQQGRPKEVSCSMRSVRPKAHLWQPRPENGTPVRYSIAPHSIRPLTEAPLRHPRRRRSLGTWLRVLIDGLSEAYVAHAAYYRLTRQGVEPSAALRIAYDLDHDKHPNPCSAAPGRKEQAS